jgi:electron transfer flavoprotein alpha subunit
MDLDYLQALMGEMPSSEEVSYRGILVVAECSGAGISRVSQELLGRARELADALGTRVSAVLLGDGLQALAPELIARGADTVYLAEDPALSVPMTATYSHVLADLIDAKKPEIVLFGATSLGRDVAPRLAARLKTGLMTDALVLELDESERLLLATNTLYGGSLLNTLAVPSGRPQIATVRAGAHRVPAADRYREGQIESFAVTLDESDSAVHAGEWKTAGSEDAGLAGARVIVAGGRGLGGPDGFSVLANLAKSLGGAVGASRGAVETGWIGKEHWVGVLGQHVSPDLYLACGIRGAIQHRLGMKGSKCVVAINTDPAAPFFRFADYGLVGDYRDIVPALVKALA